MPVFLLIHPDADMAVSFSHDCLLSSYLRLTVRFHFDGGNRSFVSHGETQLFVGVLGAFAPNKGHLCYQMTYLLGQRRKRRCAGDRYRLGGFRGRRDRFFA